MIVVIRAGGSGTRVWPISRARKPKQFLPLLGNTTLLRQKFELLRPAVSSTRDIFVSVAEPFLRTARAILPELARQQFILEPVSRNTGPAIALESLVIAGRRSGDPVIASVTADDVYRNQPAYRRSLLAAEAFLQRRSDFIVTVGSKSQRKDSGISYIQPGRSLGRFRGQTVRRVAAFVEKPHGRTLNRLFVQPGVTGHTGEYVWRLSTILDAFVRDQAWFSRLAALPAPTSQAFQTKLRRAYRSLPSMSIETAVTAQAKNIAVVGGDLGWSDTGKWNLIYDLLAKAPDANVFFGDIHAVATRGSLVMAPRGKAVGLIGLEDYIVIDTPDALLVCPREHAPDVKQVVDLLKSHRKHRFL